MSAATRLLPQEHENRWREFWAAKAPSLQRARIIVAVHPQRAQVMRRIGADLCVLLDSFSIDDSPAGIESRLAELVGGAV